MLPENDPPRPVVVIQVQLSCYSEKARGFVTHDVVRELSSPSSEKARGFVTHDVVIERSYTSSEKARGCVTHDVVRERSYTSSEKARGFVTHDVVIERSYTSSEKARGCVTHDVVRERSYTSSENDPTRPAVSPAQLLFREGSWFCNTRCYEGCAVSTHDAIRVAGFSTHGQVRALNSPLYETRSQSQPLHISAPLPRLALVHDKYFVT
ncbi:hypothetical protein J6590_018951 [Homalodisca vitripennis]|nr:hypothetical protein J6590_018951 [Homalodisca vitripennis]